MACISSTKGSRDVDRDFPGLFRLVSDRLEQGLASLFEDGFGLMPLEAWLPGFMFRHPQQSGWIVDFIKALLPPEINSLKVLEERPLLTTPDGADLPVSELSDSYRSYVAWISDPAYHLAMVCPPNRRYQDMEGVVLVDEVDLHLHPKWQRTLLKQLSENLPKMQFILTSHSPLIAGSLPAANTMVIGRDDEGFPTIQRLEQEIRGLDADQVLLTPAFGLESSRTPDFEPDAAKLYRRAAAGDRNAALKLMGLYSEGLDEGQ